jgi:membrane-associated phospholipid phosphatase
MDYKTFYEKLSAPFRGRERLTKTVGWVETALVVGTGLAFVAVCAYRAFFSPFSWLQFAVTVGCPALCLVAVSLLRKLVKRKRPYERGVTPLRAKNSTGNSFPSRHVACAAVIATVALPCALWAGVSLYAASLCIAFIRLLLGHHYPTDLLVGALLGVAFGLPTWLV